MAGISRRLSQRFLTTQIGTFYLLDTHKHLIPLRHIIDKFLSTSYNLIGRFLQNMVVEVRVDNTNLPEGRIKVVWEIMPGDAERIFREITSEEIEPSFFCADSIVETADYPLIPYPLLNPEDDCLDRVWTQTVIKINYQPSQRFDENEL